MRFERQGREYPSSGERRSTVIVRLAARDGPALDPFDGPSASWVIAAYIGTGRRTGTDSNFLPSNSTDPLKGPPWLRKCRSGMYKSARARLASLRSALNMFGRWLMV